MKILLAVDGSKHSLHAVDSLIAHADWYRERPTVELVTVHLPVPHLPGLSKLVGKAQLQQYYREEGEARLAEARSMLEDAGIDYEPRILVGAGGRDPGRARQGQALRHDRPRQPRPGRGRQHAARLHRGQGAAPVLRCRCWWCVDLQ